jgi:hypothetical protein
MTALLPIVWIIVFSTVLNNLADRAAAADLTPLEAGYRQMYDQQFDKAHDSFHQWKATHPDDPMGPASDAAAYLFGELDRLNILKTEFFSTDTGFLNMRHPIPDASVKRHFEDALNASAVLADRRLAATPSDENALFATVLRMGLQSDYTGLIERHYLASVADMKQGRGFAERLLMQDPDNYDVYLAIGVENYILSLKSPPVRWFLRAGGAQTDKSIGLQNLAMTAEKGHYLMPFARLLLTVAALRDMDLVRAREGLAWLVAEFPDNRLYREELAKLPSRR